MPHFSCSEPLPITINPLTERIEIFRPSVIGDPAKRPDPYAVVKRDGYRSFLDVRPVRVLPFQNRVIARRPNPPEITLIDEYLRYLVPTKISRDHVTTALFEYVGEFATP